MHNADNEPEAVRILKAWLETKRRKLNTAHVADHEGVTMSVGQARKLAKLLEVK